MSDHFSRVATAYAAARPTYPPALFDWLAAQCGSRDLAWDAGTGNGQAALELALRFDRVWASDLSAQQIAQAPQRANVTWRVAPSQHSDLADASADLVTVAQALHWFDLDAFYTEVRRVLKPGGLVAAWTYDTPQADDTRVNDEIAHLYHDVVGPWWPPERIHPETGYSRLAFPFTRLTPPAFDMAVDWRLDDLLAYFRSWSATGRMTKETGRDPVAEMTPRLTAAWGHADRRRISWPLTVLTGRA